MNCMVCQRQFDPNDPDICYCPRCGWSLGQLSVALHPETLILAGPRPVPLTLICRNTGFGTLRCELDQESLPAGVTLAPGSESSLQLTSQPQEIRLLVDPRNLDKSLAVLPVVLHSYDRRGQHRMDFRPASLEAGRVAQPCALPIQRMRFGPVQIFQEMLLFRNLQRRQKLLVQNLGDVEVMLALTAPPGFQLRYGSQPPAGSMTLRLSGTPVPEEITVEAITTVAPVQRGGTPLILRVEVADLPEDSRDIQLLWIPEETVETQRKRWIIGIDFGTAKTAIFFSDCNLPQPQPRPARWQMPTGDIRIKVPSVIMYPYTSPFPPRCGWDVPETAEVDGRDVVVRSIKKRLTDETAIEYELSDGTVLTVDQVVEHYLRFIVGKFRQQDVFRGEGNPFDNAQVVLSLPVRDDEEQFEEQKRRTIHAAVRVGLNEDQILCYTEPECAAVDFLRRRQEMGMSVQQGDLLCVFDCGAGTTDICLLQIHYSGGELSFTRRALAGFPFGGDVIDELLTQYVLDEWLEKGKFHEYNADFSMFHLKGEAQARTRRFLLSALRRVKERLAFVDPDQLMPNNEPVVSFSYNNDPADAIPITWSLIETLFRPYVQKMLHEGFDASDLIPDWSKEQPQGRPVGVKLPSLNAVLWREGLDAVDIRWLCLTGGSSFIPFLVKMLKQMFPQASLVPPVTMIPDLLKEQDTPMTLNVAQGAAARPLYRVEGQLPLDYLLQFSSSSGVTDPTVVLSRGGAPGKIGPQQAYRLMAGDTGTLRLIAQVGGERGVVYKKTLKNPYEDKHISILAQVEYGRDMKVYLTISFGVDNEVIPILEKIAVVE